MFVPIAKPLSITKTGYLCYLSWTCGIVEPARSTCLAAKKQNHIKHSNIKLKKRKGGNNDANQSHTKKSKISQKKTTVLKKHHGSQPQDAVGSGIKHNLSANDYLVYPAHNQNNTVLSSILDPSYYNGLETLKEPGDPDDLKIAFESWGL